MALHLRLRLAGVAAALVLATAAGTANAAISVNERAFRIPWASLEFKLQEGGGIDPTMRCQVTLEGSFNAATFSTARSAAVGAITRASVGTCTGGTLRVLTETMPWTLNYLSIARFPTVLTMSYSGFSMQASIGGETCLARSTAERPARAKWRIQEDGRVAVDGDEAINLPVTGIGCEGLDFAYDQMALATRAGSAEPLIMREI